MLIKSLSLSCSLPSTICVDVTDTHICCYFLLIKYTFPLGLFLSRYLPSSLCLPYPYTHNAPIHSNSYICPQHTRTPPTHTFLHSQHTYTPFTNVHPQYTYTPAHMHTSRVYLLSAVVCLYEHGCVGVRGMCHIYIYVYKHAYVKVYL